MDLNALREFFLTCTLLHTGLLLFSWIFLIIARSWVYKIHSRWFPMKEETFSIILYSYVAVYKILLIVFALVPWLALELIC